MSNTKEEIQKLNPKVLYMNKPISEANADEIGVGVYVDYLESAIEKGADMIAIISGFGTGKSSLIELLKAKYHGWKKEKKQERVYCQVNLWSQLETGGTKKEDGIKSIDLHRSFLYQLISAVYPQKSSYFSRRTGRNFGLFKISAESPVWSAMINVAIVVLFAIALLHSFAEEIVTGGVIAANILYPIILGGYSFSAIVAISLFLKTEIIFSSKQSEKNREIEENELIDLYKEHVLGPKKWHHKIFKNRATKHIIVVIEDLDRTDAGDSVYLFLKELRKYYIPDEQKESSFLNRITFIVNIMPENTLQKKCKLLQNKEEYIYDKIFDYSFNLNKINIDNFDVVLEALILEKKAELQEIGIEVAVKDNVHNIAGMQWIILGKNLSIRQVKDRLNEAIVLYDSIKDKFGAGKADFEKCAAVSYLRSEFPVAFNSLSDRTLEKMVTAYAKNQMTKSEFVAAHCVEAVDEDFYKRLYDMIEAHLIDDNYRTYFYNYPKDSHLYTIRETRVRNMLIYNEGITEDLKADITEVAKERPEAIVDAMRKSLELVKELPGSVLFSSELWNIANVEFHMFLDALVYKELSEMKEVLLEHKDIIDSVVNMDSSTGILCNAILHNDSRIIVQIRNYLLEKHIHKICEYIPLFRVEDAPLKIEELHNMAEVPMTSLFDVIRERVNGLEKEVIDEIHKRILNENDEAILASAKFFYSEIIECFDMDEEIADYIYEYMNHRQHLENDLTDAICEAIKEEKIGCHYYFTLINHMPIEEINQAQLEHIVELDFPGMINKEICDRLNEEKYNAAYLVNMINRFADEISMTWEEVYAVLKQEGKEIWTYHPHTFKLIRQWACKTFKDEVVVAAEYFKNPYPLITVEEIQCMIEPDSAMRLYDVSRADEDEGEAFVEFCNRQFRKSTVAYRMFEFVSRMDKSIIKTVFYKLDMHNVRFSLMGMASKKRIVELLRVPLSLNDSKEVVPFMSFTECLLPELEKQIQPDLKKDEALCKAYIKAIQKCGKVSDIAYKNLFEMPNIYAYGEVINEKLLEKEEYTRYVCSKTQEHNSFKIEHDKLDILWNTYLTIFKNVNRYQWTAPLMGKNQEFLKLVQNRNAYKDLPEESRLALAKIAQDENTLLDVLNYTDEFVTEYFSSIVGFTSKKAAETFVKIMAKHQKYAQKKVIYDNVHPKLENAQLKGWYTKLYRAANS